MGSPSSRLKTAEQYRPWVDAGLEYVFSPGHAQVASQAVYATPAQAVQTPTRQQTQPAPQPVGQGGTPQRQVHSATQQNSQSVAQQVQQSNSVVPPISQPQNRNVKFPEPWNSFLGKVKAQAPKVVCTYMELGLDLGGQPDPRRSAVLRNTLTHHLKWPPGTAAFWPMSALVNGALQPNREMFWNGWQLWRTPYIVCFGDEALNVIHPLAEPGGNTYLYEEITIFVAPPLAKLVTMLPHEQQLSTELLGSVRI